MKLYYRHLPIFLLGTLICFHSSGQENVSGAFIKVDGQVKKPLTLYADDVRKMKHSTATLKEHDGKKYNYSGVDLQQILEMAGVTQGKELRGENLTKYLLVKCADGYQIIFSLAETDSSFTDRKILLADALDGKPLPAGKGPFRLIVPDEKRPARSGLQVTELVIGFVKE